VEGTLAHSVSENVSVALSALFKRHPGLAEAFSSASGPQAVREMLDSLDGDLAPMLRTLGDASRAWVAAEKLLFRRMAEATGLPEEEVRREFNPAGLLRGGSFHYRRDDWRDIMNDPSASLLTLPSTEEIEQTYEGLVERFVSRKGALYQSVDSLPGLSAEYRAVLKQAVLKGSELKLPSFFERCSRIARGMYAAPLLRALEAGADDAAVFAEVRKLAAQYQNGSNVAFPQDILADMGSDETSSIQRFSTEMFIDMTPALKGSLSPARRDALMDMVDEELSGLTRQLVHAKAESPEFRQLQELYAQTISLRAILREMAQ
jgi:hypothetical protein